MALYFQCWKVTKDLFVSFDSKPQVNYATALDVFIILCFAIVFAALVEFAMLNFLDTLVRKLKRKESSHYSMKVRLPKQPAAFFILGLIMGF